MIVWRRGGVRTTGDEVLSAHGRGDCDIVAGECVGNDDDDDGQWR